MSYPIHRVYVDMDDTLNSFTLFVMNQLGCLVGPFDYHKFPDVGYRLYDAYKLAQKRLSSLPEPETEEEFWLAVQKRRTSLNAPVAREAQFILDFAASLVGQKNVFICTKLFCAEQATDKLVWLEKHFPAYAKKYVLCNDKSVVSRPDTLLIDDSDATIDEFRSGGGHTILVPRPWNSLRGYPTYSYLLRQFAVHLTYKERLSNVC